MVTEWSRIFIIFYVYYACHLLYLLVIASCMVSAIRLWLL